MFDGVFHQGLNHHGWELGRHQTIANVNRCCQALFHAHFQDLEVGPDHGQLAAQVARRAVAGLAQAGHAGAQQGDEVLLHHAGFGRIGLDQVVNRRQGVEQKVRLHLRLHGRHARFHDLAFERFGLCRFGRLRGLHLGLHTAFVQNLDEC